MSHLENDHLEAQTSSEPATLKVTLEADSEDPLAPPVQSHDPLNDAEEEEDTQFRRIEKTRITYAIPSLPTWQNALPASDSQSSPVPSSSSAPASRFPFRSDLNQQILLWRGDILKIEADVIVNSTNEPLTDTSGLSGRIFAAAGPELRREVDRLEGCRTGECKLTNGYGLTARAVAHTVGPRYNIKYKTAAENALHSCYRSTLQLVKEAGYSSVAFCVINSPKRGYPPLEGAHIAVRTVRRFLEHFGEGMRAVVFVVSKQSDHDIYASVLPLYFPRSPAEEAAAASLLPEYTGNQFGETVVEERKIRIDRFPGVGGGHGSEGSEEEDGDGAEDGAYAAVGFTRMAGDIDVELQKRVAVQQRSASAETLYQQYLNRAKAADLADVARRNILYQSGTTSLGKPIVVAVGSNLPRAQDVAEMQRLFLYIIRTMDPIVESNYIVVYLHAGFQDSQRPSLDWLRSVYNIWDQKYSSNLDSLYIVHPTWGLKVFRAMLSPFVSSAFSAKMRYVDSLARLYDILDHSQLRLPEVVYQEDQRLNGGPSSAQPAILHDQL